MVLIKRILWPARASLFALIGGAVGLFGDLVSFFAEFLSAGMLVLIFAGITVAAALLCLQRAFMVNEGDPAAVEEVVQCAPCDAFRFGLFATAAFVLLMLIGQGQSATETVGRQLGLIQSDVTAIRSDVSDLHEMAQPHMIIKRPASAADHFNNAWLYHTMQRNPAKAREEIRALYARHTPRKMDAAQLYLDAGSAVTGRAQLVEEMQALARKTGDATLLVAAARGAESFQAGDIMIAEARRMDPELPFVWWDMQRIKPPRISGITPAERLKLLRVELADIEKFRSLYRAHPPTHFFFIPQYQGDLESLARQTSESLSQSVATFDDMVSGRLSERTRAEARKAYEEAMRNR
ncbi:hypothetical protein BSL82_09840 [Tardibacter chloracetimidivorans]|uniref:Uncharacterized protein n=1 Tax=Tardibacter chloracetimidivorans TaxID=1921510 RepID=A0A1L3ZVH2_9SPHN|nr:hypothetical protein BSL82_09840 [Tardibacter chloracetimidivorans]